MAYEGSAKGLSSPLRFLQDGELEFKADDALVKQWVNDIISFEAIQSFASGDMWPGLEGLLFDDVPSVDALLLYYVPARLRSLSDWIRGVEALVGAGPVPNSVSVLAKYVIKRTGQDGTFAGEI